MKKTIYAILLLLVAVTSFQIWVTKDRTGQKKEMEATAQPEETAIGGTFTLTDQNGQVVHDTDFRGRVMLVAFGFTHCPDVCPITVATLSKTLELLGDKADQVAGLFITVDPQRDTPQAMKDFLSNFDKHIVGLTGTELQVKQVADAYKVYYARALADEAKAGNQKAPDADYNVDHSSYIYMMGKEGQFIKVFPYNVSEQELAHAVKFALR
jgi:protein SCO1/2